MKFVLGVMGTEDKEACGMKQLCGVLEDGIEEVIHTVRILWQKHNQE